MSRILKSSRIVVNDDKLPVGGSKSNKQGKTQSAGSNAQTMQNDNVMATQSRSDAVSEATKIITKAGHEAGVIIAEAQVEANKITDKMKKQCIIECTHLEHESEQKGYNEGFDKGAKDAKTLNDMAQSERDSAVKERQEMISTLEPEMVAIILETVKKLIGDAAVIKPDIIVNLIKQGLSDATLTGGITIRVSKEDYDTVLAAKDDILSFAKGADNIDILKELSLNKSDCIIETPFGIIDSSLDGQFESLKESLYFILDNTISKK